MSAAGSGPSTRGRLVAGVAIALACLGCGGGGEKLSAKHVPLVAKATVVAQSYGCPATPDVCFRWVIVRGSGSTSAQRLKAAERRLLASRGWRFRSGATPKALAADAPDRKLFLSFETGSEELADQRAGRTSWGDKTVGVKLRALTAQHAPVLALTVERPPGK